MTTEGRTPEQQNEQDSKLLLVCLLGDLRKQTNLAIDELESALEVLHNVQRSLPEDTDVDSLGLSAVAKAVESADDEGLESVHIGSAERGIHNAVHYLSEAKREVAYLRAGDFRE